MPSRRFRLAGLQFTALICFLLLVQAKGLCQVSPSDLIPANDTGVNPYETYGGNHENINLATGNLNIIVPLLTIPGRDGQNLLINLAFDSKDTIVGMSRWAGQNQDPRWQVRSFTVGISTWHEFGHAWGEINGRPGSKTNSEALQWENRMREQVYGPLGPNNAPRITH